MKKTIRKWINSILLTGMLASLCFPVTAYAADAQWRMMHGEQDALVIGTIREVTDAGYEVDVVQALWCEQDAVKGRMIPLDEVPDRITIKEIRYHHSYHQKETPHTGDHIFISVDKKGKVWEQQWLGMEVSSTDISEMAFAAPENMTNETYAWQIFVSSGGKTTNFAYEGEEKLYVDGEVVFEMHAYQEESAAENKTESAVSAEAPSDKAEEKVQKSPEAEAAKEVSAANETQAVSFTVIGGADGPTSIFLAGKLGSSVRTVGIIAGIVLSAGAAVIIVVLVRKCLKKK